MTLPPLDTLTAAPAVIMPAAVLLEALLPCPPRLRPSALVPLLQRLGHKVCRPDGGQTEQWRSGLLIMPVVWLPCAALLWSVRNLALSEPLFDALVLLLLIESRPLRELASAIRHLLGSGTLPVARLQAGPWLKRECQSLSALGLAKAVTESCTLRLVGQWVGPLFGFALAGVQGALLWRLAQLLNQAFSPKSATFAHFGRPASALYQALMTIPALLLLLPLLLRQGARALARQGLQWPWPLGGALLGAIAHTLSVRLGGPRLYGGDKQRWVVLDGGHEPDGHTPARALARLQFITWCWLGLGIIATLAGWAGVV